MTGTTDNDEPMRDRVAATIAKAQDADYWVDEIREWEARADWERETYADSLPSMAYEDRSAFLRAADDVLALLAERAAK